MVNLMKEHKQVKVSVRFVTVVVAVIDDDSSYLFCFTPFECSL